MKGDNNTVLTTLNGDTQRTEIEASRRIGSVLSMVHSMDSIDSFDLPKKENSEFLQIWHICSKNPSRFWKNSETKSHKNPSIVIPSIWVNSPHSFAIFPDTNRAFRSASMHSTIGERIPIEWRISARSATGSRSPHSMTRIDSSRR